MHFLSYLFGQAIEALTPDILLDKEGKEAEMAEQKVKEETKQIVVLVDSEDSFSSVS